MPKTFFLGLFCLSVIGATAWATEPIDGDDTGEADNYDIDMESFFETDDLLNSITVHQMDYSAGFDCDDFAWCFDDACERRGIPAWELMVSCEEDYTTVERQAPYDTHFDSYFCVLVTSTEEELACWFQDGSTPVRPSWVEVLLDDRNGAHVLNIVQYPNITSDEEYYCIIEPSSTTLNTIACWFQEPTGSSVPPGGWFPESTGYPALSEEVLAELKERCISGYAGLCQEASVMTTGIYEGGHLDPSEAPFTDIPYLVEAFNEATCESLPTD